MAVAAVVAQATRAMAQIVQSEIDSEPGSSETTSLVTSNTEVRRAILGLLTLAFIAGVLGIIYWYKTGQQARERFARKYGGRHLAGQGRLDVVDERGHWGTEAGLIQPVFAASELPLPDTPTAVDHTAPWPANPPHVAHGTGYQQPQWVPQTRPTWEPATTSGRHRSVNPPARAQRVRRR